MHMPRKTTSTATTWLNQTSQQPTVPYRSNRLKLQLAAVPAPSRFRTLASLKNGRGIGRVDKSWTMAGGGVCSGGDAKERNPDLTCIS